MAHQLPPLAEKTMPKTPAIDFKSSLDTSVLKGKSVLITGGASGIGRVCVKELASLGAFVTFLDLQEAAGIAIAKELTAAGHKAQYIQCDVSDYLQQASAFKSAVQFGGGKIDIVVPGAGIIHQKNLFEMAAETEPSLDAAPPEPGLSTVDVNLKGVYYSTYLALHYFRLAPPTPESTPFKKTVILISSVAGFLGYPASTTYSMSKLGVRGLFHGIRNQALDQSPQVRINLIAPWFIDTPMAADLATAANFYGYAPIENVVSAIVRISADENITGRAAIIMPEGNFDLGDNLWEGYAGPILQERMGERMTIMQSQLIAAQHDRVIDGLGVNK